MRVFRICRNDCNECRVTVDDYRSEITDGARCNSSQPMPIELRPRDRRLKEIVVTVRIADRRGQPFPADGEHLARLERLAAAIAIQRRRRDGK
jgi:hypothetical protein